MRASTLFLAMVVALGGCVHNWSAYEPPDDSGTVNADVTRDVAIDRSVMDTFVPPPDVVDTGVDRQPPQDVPIDRPTDVVTVDVQPDVQPDVTVDVPVDVSLDGSDVATDSPLDVAVDAPCGRDGEACCAGPICFGGNVCTSANVCAPTCTTGTTRCFGACYDTQTDVNHCGSCTNRCNTGRVCTNGNCVRP